MAQRTGVPIVAGPNRNDDVVKLLGNGNVDVIISDDGLQHYALQGDIEIAVIDQSRGLGNQRCLPAGPLREPAGRLNKCDFVVVNEVDAAAEFSMQLLANEIYNLKSLIKQPLSEWSGVMVHAVTGIGNPSRFFLTLINAGLNVIEHPFPDHYQFNESDIAFDDELPVVMTEKDAVKCFSFSTKLHWSIPVTATLSDGFAENLLAKLSSIQENK